MAPLTEEEYRSLNLDELVTRMDDILDSSFIIRRMFSPLSLNVRSIIYTKKVQEFPPDLRRKLAHKTFGFIVQLFNANETRRAEFKKDKEDHEIALNLYTSARNQWVIVSSRMAFEYFLSIIYMIGSGSEIKSDSKIKAFKKFLKKPDNPYIYFVMSIVKATHFDRQMRFPEVHASSKMNSKILKLSATEIDNDILELISIMMNQWQYVIEFSKGNIPTGWVHTNSSEEEKNWQRVCDKGDAKEIASEIEKLFDNAGA